MSSSISINRASKCFILLIAALAMFIGERSAFALPEDRIVAYHLRQTPGDPETPWEFSIILELKAADSDDNKIGWEIETITIKHYVPNEDTVAWVEESPSVDSPDGLWWVEHDDPEEPKLEEFIVSPSLKGIAERTTAGDDLDYEFYAIAASGGNLYSALQPSPTLVAYITFRFKLYGAQPPVIIDEGNNKEGIKDEDEWPIG